MRVQSAQRARLQSNERGARAELFIARHRNADGKREQSDEKY